MRRSDRGSPRVVTLSESSRRNFEHADLAANRVADRQCSGEDGLDKHRARAGVDVSEHSVRRLG